MRPWRCKWTYWQIVPLLEHAFNVADRVEYWAHVCSDGAPLTVEHLLADLQQPDPEVLKQLELQLGKLILVISRRQRPTTICSSCVNNGNKHRAMLFCGLTATKNQKHNDFCFLFNHPSFHSYFYVMQLMLGDQKWIFWISAASISQATCPSCCLSSIEALKE